MGRLITSLLTGLFMVVASASEVTISNRHAPVPLGGVFDGPAKPTVAVLVIPGSGPTDHDGNSPLGVQARPYKLLADQLVARGYAVARIDKRGVGLSVSPKVDGNHVTIAVYASDVAAWVADLRQRTGLSCIWLLGHSEGALVAEVAAKNTPGICGLVLVSAPGEPAGDLLKVQFRQRLAGTRHASELPAIEATIDQLASGHPVDSQATPLAARALFRPEVQAYLIDWFGHDPAAEIRRINLPVFVVEGGRDLQVDSGQGKRLLATGHVSRLLTVPAMNHVLKDVAEDERANLESYTLPGPPVSQELVASIVSFIDAPQNDSTHQPHL